MTELESSLEDAAQKGVQTHLLMERTAGPCSLYSPPEAEDAVAAPDGSHDSSHNGRPWLSLAPGLAAVTAVNDDNTQANCIPEPFIQAF